MTNLKTLKEAGGKSYANLQLLYNSTAIKVHGRNYALSMYVAEVKH